MRRYLLCPLALTLLAGADWPHFRGNDGGKTADPVPTEFDASSQNVAWKYELPGRGISSPVVAGGRVFVTAASGPKLGELHVVALDATTGRELWRHSAEATGPTQCHKQTTTAAPSPATDGLHVVALFGTNDCFGFSADGELLWKRSLFEENPGAAVGHGLASSPIIIDGIAVLQIENPENSFACGIDVRTGKDVWKIPRPKDRNWSSPVPLGDGLVLMQGKQRISAVDAKTGEEAWGLNHEGDEKASSTVADGVLYVPGKGGLMALKLDGRSDPEQLWQSGRLSPQTASPVVIGGQLFVVRGAVLTKGDARTGEQLGSTRINGKHTSSPIAAGGVIYCFNEEGVAHVVRPGDEDEDELIGKPQMGEPVIGTPSAAGGALYVRGEKHLWKISH